MTWSVIETKTGSNASATSVSVTFDSAPSSGEVVFLEVFSQANSATFTPPSGFVLQKRVATGSARTVATYLKIAGGSESATYSISADSTSAMGIIGKRISTTDGAGTDTAITLHAIGIGYGTSVTSLSTPDCPAPAGSFVIATAYSNGTLSSFSGDFGSTTSTSPANGGILVSATKTSTGAVEKLTQNLTAGNTRQVVMLTVLLPATMQSLKRAKINIAGGTSQVEADGYYYNALAMSTTASVSDLRNRADTANTGWGVATTNTVAHSSTGNAWTDDYFAQAPMQSFARLDRTADSVGQLTFSGLDNSKTYGIIFAGHIGSGSDFTDVTISSTTKQFKAAVQPSDGRFAGFIASPSSGSIVVDLSLPASGSQYGTLSAIDIVEFPSGATPATLSAPTPSGTLGTSTTATIGATTNQNTGTLYTVLSTSSSDLDTITGTQIKAGQIDSGSAAPFSGNSSVSTTSPTIAISGLAGNTTYYYAIIQNNTNGDSNILTGSFTTAVATRSVNIPIVDGAGSPLASTSVKWWVRQSLGDAASSPNAGTSSTNGSGVLGLTGLTVAAGAAVVTVELDSDSDLSSNYYVTLA